MESVCLQHQRAGGIGVREGVLLDFIARHPKGIEETERFTAKQLGIPMPLPTAKPLFTAVGLVTMFSGLLFLRNDMFAVAMTKTDDVFS